MLYSPGIQCDRHGRYVVTDEIKNQVLVFDKDGHFVCELSPNHKTQADILDLHNDNIPDSHVELADSNLNTRNILNNGATRPSPSLNESNDSPLISRPRSSSCPAPGPDRTSTSSFSCPRYVCASACGRIFVADSANHCVRMFDPDLTYLGQFGGYGKKEGQMKFPYGVAACHDSGHVYVADHYNNRVAVFTQDGHFVQHVVTCGDDVISRPKAVAVRNSRLYVSHGDFRSDKVSIYSIVNTQSEA